MFKETPELEEESEDEEEIQQGEGKSWTQYWSEMAKEVRQNFGTNGVKTVPKTNTDSSGSGNGDPNCGIKVFVPDGMERTMEAEHVSQSINGKVKMQLPAPSGEC